MTEVEQPPYMIDKLRITQCQACLYLDTLEQMVKIKIGEDWFVICEKCFEAPL